MRSAIRLLQNYAFDSLITSKPPFVTDAASVGLGSMQTSISCAFIMGWANVMKSKLADFTATGRDKTSG